MPWITPTLGEVRKQNRDYITAHLHAAAMVPNSVLRVLSDANAGLAFLVLLYIDWLALQLLPDTAETEWLDRHADIWLPGDGRKPATFASGSGTATGINSTIVPEGSQLIGNNVLYETTEQIMLGSGMTPVAIRAIDPGIVANLAQGSLITFVSAIAGVDSPVTIVDMTGGVDSETDTELRERVLRRIQQPPMGGADYDYEAWALAVPGVTRAWANALEMGMGTVTLRFMCDDLRAEWGGFPLPIDVANVTAYIDKMRPVAVKDCFVLAPLPMAVEMIIYNLSNDTPAVRAAIEAAVEEMLRSLAYPGGTIYRSWVEEAIMSAIGRATYELNFTTLKMPSPGHLGVLGSILYAG
jgi:uncharacterized phage protein gp47/JayE